MLVFKLSPARFLALLLSLAAVFLGGCAGFSPARDPLPAKDEQAPGMSSDPLALSRATSALGQEPAGWQPWIIRPDKVRTRYAMVQQPIAGQQRNVLHASAEAAASGLWVPMKAASADTPYIRWSWRTDALIERADSTRPETEDAPLRLILAFDGDWRRLSLRDQMIAETARFLLGREMPYATIIYTWETRQPVETLIPNAHSGRVKKKVVESGRRHLGHWRNYQRNYVQDYIEAFGEAPGTLIGVGVLTDTDNTRAYAEGWYGDIQLLTPSQAVSGEPRG